MMIVQSWEQKFSISETRAEFSQEARLMRMSQWDRVRILQHSDEVNDLQTAFARTLFHNFPDLAPANNNKSNAVAQVLQV